MSTTCRCSLRLSSREAELGQTYATDPFTLADVNAEVGSGYDNIITLKESIIMPKWR